MGSGARLVTRKLLPPENHARPEQVAQSLRRNPCSRRESVVDIAQARNQTPCMLTTAGRLFRNRRSLQEDQPPAVGVKSDDWPGTEPA